MGSGLYLPPTMRAFIQQRNAQIAMAREQGLIQERKPVECPVRKAMSKDEKFVKAVEELARRRMLYWDARGESKSFDFCKQEMVEMVIKKYARDNNIE